MTEANRTTEQRAEIRGQCSCAVGMLEAAMTLVGRVSNDGPKGNPFGPDLAAINRQIGALQRKLLRLHDENET